MAPSPTTPIRKKERYFDLNLFQPFCENVFLVGITRWKLFSVENAWTQHLAVDTRQDPSLRPWTRC